jgi:Zn-dependent protease
MSFFSPWAWSAETWVVLGVLTAGFIWSVFPRQTYRIKRTVRISVDDLWENSILLREKPTTSSFITHVEWDEDGSDSGYFTAGELRSRFEQTVDHLNKRCVCLCVPVDQNNKPNGDLYRVNIAVAQEDIGSSYELIYRFENQIHASFYNRFFRLLRPLMVLNGPNIMNDALKNAGAFERFEALHGPAPAKQTIMGMPLTVTSGVLAALAFIWFAWQGTVWSALALMICLALHELGHVCAMRLFGDKDSRFYFLPIFGGVALGQQKLSADWKLVVIVLAGPAAGLLSVLACLALAYVISNEWFLACAILFALVNALNLLPIPMLDGGQILNALLRPFAPMAVRRWIATGLLSLAVAAGLYIKSSLLVVMFTFFIVLQFVGDGKDPAPERRPLSVLEGCVSAVLTLGVAVALVWLFFAVDGALEGSMTRVLADGPFSD